jgi:hypothetical protein
MEVRDSPGSVADPVVPAGDLDRQPVAVGGGHRADAVRGEELGLVEHPGQHPAQLALVEQGQQRAAAGVGLPADELAELGPAVQQVVEPGGEVRQLGEHPRLENGRREQRDEPDHRADPDRPGLHVAVVVGAGHEVVAEAVLLVPDPARPGAELRRHLGDGEEVLDELGGDVLVGLVVAGSSRAICMRCSA